MAALSLCSARGAHAQTAKPASAEEAPAVEGVVVTGQKAAVRTSIDRRTYAVSRDVVGGAGSVSDVLANLPSVDVDLEGNVRLRGSSRVQILIDGKPSALVNGAMRPVTLQQMQAATVESIEIMTNPSAEFSPDGSAGIINIVTKKKRAAGRTGALTANAGTRGRARMALTGAQKGSRHTLTGSLSAQRQASEGLSYQERTRVDPATGETTRSTTDGRYDNERRGWGASLVFDYDPTPRDRLSASVAHYQNPSSSASWWRRASETADVVTLDYDRLSRGASENASTQVSGGYRHSFAEKGREFRLDARWSESEQDSELRYDFDYRTPAPAVRIEEELSVTEDALFALSADYVHPGEDGATLKLGYALRNAHTDSTRYRGLIDPATGESTSLPDVSNRFLFGEAIHALYGTYQRPFGKWTVLAGLRVEHAATEIDQRTTNESHDITYLRAYPSLHLQYDLTDAQKLRLSYSHRVSRPSGSNLNPFVVFIDEFNLFAGNPRLEPQDSHSFEVGWEHRKGGRSLLATLYARRNVNGFETVRIPVSPTVILTTVRNLAESTSGGLELAGSGQLGPALSYNVSGAVFYNEIKSGRSGSDEVRAALGHSAKARVDYRITPAHAIQVTANYGGRRVFSQGYSPASGSVNLGYQYKIRPDLILVATAADIFRTARIRSVIETDDLREVSGERILGRAVSVTLTKQFGGRVREGQYEYPE